MDMVVAVDGYFDRCKNLFSKDVEFNVGCFVGFIHHPENKNTLAKNKEIMLIDE